MDEPGGVGNHRGTGAGRMTTEEKYRLANQLRDTAAELARLGAMCCSNDPRTELERMAVKWLKAAAWMKNKADQLKGIKNDN